MVGRSGWGDRDGRPALGDQRGEDRAQLGAVAERRAGEHESLRSLANAVAGIRWLEAGLWMRDAGERTLGFVETLRVGQEAPGLPRERRGEREPASFDGKRVGH